MDNQRQLSKAIKISEIPNRCCDCIQMKFCSENRYYLCKLSEELIINPSVGIKFSCPLKWLNIKN